MECRCGGDGDRCFDGDRVFFRSGVLCLGDGVRVTCRFFRSEFDVVDFSRFDRVVEPFSRERERVRRTSLRGVRLRLRLRERLEFDDDDEDGESERERLNVEANFLDLCSSCNFVRLRLRLRLRLRPEILNIKFKFRPVYRRFTKNSLTLATASIT